MNTVAQSDSWQSSFDDAANEETAEDSETMSTVEEEAF